MVLWEGSVKVSTPGAHPERLVTFSLRLATTARGQVGSSYLLKGEIASVLSLQARLVMWTHLGQAGSTTLISCVKGEETKWEFDSPPSQPNLKGS